MGNLERKYLPNWQDVIDIDWLAKPIAEETRRQTVLAAQSGRYLVTDTRIATGRFYTDKEYCEMRKRVLSTPLP